ncbi:Protein kinase-like protein [Quillaja saponaria]|uniref:Protein kinase-like protein n=1 Tax=Quillaja saponaria TaxID=32244 RepID=A0AAD7Q587_QUISA|nr:Protein kinase-like protein [Quillaja saponaria]
MIKHHPNFEEIDVQNYTRMILKGLQCIHAKGYVHCDLKPSNVLVFPSKDGCPCRLKITDFGLSKEPGETVGEQYKFHATPRYMSPESLVIGQIGVALDIWSLGCIVVEMVTKKTMWGDHKDDYLGELMCQLVAGNDDVLLPESLSEEGKDFLNKCFEIDPRKRWTASMLLNHPFIAS